MNTRRIYKKGGGKTPHGSQARFSHTRASHVVRNLKKPKTVSVNPDVFCASRLQNFFKFELPELRKQCGRLAKVADMYTEYDVEDDAEGDDVFSPTYVKKQMEEMVEDIDSLVEINDTYGNTGFMKGMPVFFNKLYEQFSEFYEDNKPTNVEEDKSFDDLLKSLSSMGI